MIDRKFSSFQLERHFQQAQFMSKFYFSAESFYLDSQSKEIAQQKTKHRHKADEMLAFVVISNIFTTRSIWLLINQMS